MSLLINQAYAATNGAIPSGNESFGSIALLGIFILFFYFILWRPQQKRAKEHRALIQNLAKGDEVVTNGGLLGRIERLTDDFVTLLIAEGMEIKFQRSAIHSVLPKGTLESI